MAKKIFCFLVLFLLSLNFIFAFSANPSFVKVVLNKGEKVDSTLNVLYSGEEKEFVFESVGDFFSLGKESFVSSSDFQVGISFDKADLNEGVYIGEVRVSSEAESVVVPVILEVETQNPDYAIVLEVGSKNKMVGRGDEFTSEFTIYNLKDKKANSVGLDYSIFNLEGNLINSRSESVEIESKATLSKSLDIPEDADEGKYIFVVIVSDDNSVSTASSFLEVEGDKPFIEFTDKFFFAILALIIVIIFLVILYILYERRNLFSKLRRKHAEELEYYKKEMKIKENEILKKLSSSKDKKKMQKELSEAKEKIIEEMKKEQEKQKKELRRVKLKKVKLGQEDLEGIHRDAYLKALKTASISKKLRDKLSALNRAYDEGVISKDSLKKGSSRIKNAHRKLRK